MSILNSLDMEDLKVSEHLLRLLSKLNIDEVDEAYSDVNDEMDYEFTNCCSSRLKYCECRIERADRAYDQWKDSQLESE